MKLAPGVKIAGMRPELLLGISIVEKEFAFNFTITHMLDGVHSRGSLHYVGFAVDLRTRDWPGDQESFKALLPLARKALGENFDLVYEDPGGPNQHLHLEFQPK